MSISTPETKITGPFPGLRPFEKHEAKIFFGRGIQVDDMIRRLEDHRFLAVVGSSGCGKSSLVRAGLLPALEEGELFSAGNDWLMVIAKPGATPFRNLAESWNIARNSVLQDEAATSVGKQNVSLAEAVLQSGPLGFLELINDAQIPPERNILLLIDQFEEIFRFRYEEKIREGQAPEDASDDANAFVSLLLATVQQSERPVYVVLTMRSDFLGDCNAFHGLPEAINDSQFLTPRMNQDQIRQAILGPLHVFGGSAEPALVNRIIGDIGNDPDQLPLMQHVLLRMWNQEKTQATWTDDRARSNKVMGTSTVSEYKQLGGVQDALSNHATEIFKELKAQGDERIVEMLFRSLRQRGEKGQEVRRPETIENIAATIEDDVDDSLINEVIKVVDAFRRLECSFLMPPFGVELTPDTLIDISHESLIRRWKQMQVWADNEDESAEILEYLVRSAKAYDNKTGDVLERKNLNRVNEWKERLQPTSGWAMRYVSPDDLRLAKEFVGKSRVADNERRLNEKKQEQKELKSKFFRRMMVGFGILFALTSVLAVVAVISWYNADAAKNKAKDRELAATTALDDAKTREQEAKTKLDDATNALNYAKTREQQATTKLREANEALGIAQTREGKANKKLTEATESLVIAQKREDEARNALGKAQTREKAANEKASAADNAKIEADRARDNALAATLLSLSKVNSKSVEIILVEQKKLGDEKLIEQLKLALSNGIFRGKPLTEKEVARFHLAMLFVAEDTEQIPHLLKYELNPNVDQDEFQLVRSFLADYPSELEPHIEELWQKLQNSLEQTVELDKKIAKFAAENSVKQEILNDEQNERTRFTELQPIIFNSASLLVTFDPQSEKKWTQVAERLMDQLTKQNPDEFGNWTQELTAVRDSLAPSLWKIYKSKDTLANQKLNASELLSSFGSPPDTSVDQSDLKSATPVIGMVSLQEKDEEFYIGKYEVTQKQYEFVMEGKNPSQSKNPKGPVNNVNWKNAMEFCQELNKMDKFPKGLGLGKLPDNFEYSLPTEKQWEFACTDGGKKTKYNLEELDRVAYCQSNLRGKGRFYYGPTTVGTKEPSELGLYDMMGNVSEWCLGDDGKAKVIRGGSYFDNASTCNPTSSRTMDPTTTADRFGFRIVAVKKPKKKEEKK